MKELSALFVGALAALSVSGCDKVNQLMGKKMAPPAESSANLIPSPPPPTPLATAPATASAGVGETGCSALESCCGAISKNPGSPGLSAACAGLPQLKSLGSAADPACAQTLSGLRPGLAALSGGSPPECGGGAAGSAAAAGTGEGSAPQGATALANDAPPPAAVEPARTPLPAAPPPPPAHGQKRKKGR